MDFGFSSGVGSVISGTVSPATISELNKKAYVHIEDWRNGPLQGGRYPYVYVVVSTVLRKLVCRLWYE